jgi:integrase
MQTVRRLGDVAMSIHRRVTKSRGTTWVVRFRDPIPRERTFDRKADAERFERFVRHQLDTDQYLDPESARVTVRDWAERWWPTVERSERAPSTISGYESALRLQVLPHLGDRRLRTLRRIDMEEWLSHLRAAGYSNSTIHSARTVLGMVLASAMDARIIAGNPLTGLRLPKGSSRSRDALTIEQVEALATAVDPWWRPFVLVLAYCGLRPGEAIALRRKHLDDLGRLTVERGMTEHRGTLLERDTKTHRSRVVEVPASVLAELRTHVEAHVGSDPTALLFTTPSGDPVRLSNWRHRVWDPLACELRLPEWATPYVLRHTAASLLAQSGVPVTAAAASLGHDPAIFLRTYAHLYPGDLAAVADAMDAARSAVVDAPDEERDPHTAPASSVARVDFAGMARRRRKQAEKHGL